MPLSNERWKYFGVGHTLHTLMNPLALERIDEIARLAQLGENARVLDIACGKATWLLRLAAHYPTMRGVGVDASPYEVPAARERVAAAKTDDRIEIVEGDGAAYDAAAGSFALTSCIGASWIWKGHGGTLAALQRWTEPGGLVIVGEPYWKHEPHAAYLAVSGMGRDDFGTHVSNIQVAQPLGLRPIYAITSSDEEWDRYEWLQQLAIDRWARENPNDPDVAAIRRRADAARDEYLQHGRDTIGFGLYVFRNEVG